MSLVASLLDQHRVAVPPEQRQTMETDSDLRQRVNVVRSTIPAVTHVDYSARVQTVDERETRASTASCKPGIR